MRRHMDGSVRTDDYAYDCSLFIKDVPSQTKDTDLRELFKSYGAIAGVNVVSQRGYAFVDYFEQSSMRAALAETTDFVLFDKTLLVEERTDRKGTHYGWDKWVMRGILGHSHRPNIIVDDTFLSLKTETLTQNVRVCSTTLLHYRPARWLPRWRCDPRRSWQRSWRRGAKGPHWRRPQGPRRAKGASRERQQRERQQRRARRRCTAQRPPRKGRPTRWEGRRRCARRVNRAFRSRTSVVRALLHCLVVQRQQQRLQRPETEGGDRARAPASVLLCSLSRARTRARGKRQIEGRERARAGDAHSKTAQQ